MPSPILREPQPTTGGMTDHLLSSISRSKRRVARDANVSVRDASNVCRVHGKIRDVPMLPIGLVVGTPTSGLTALRLEPLPDCFLVALRECRERKFTAIRMPLVDRQLVACSNDVADSLNVAKVHARGDALRVQVHGKVDEVDVAGAFPVAEQAAFNSVCAGQHSKLCSGNARPCGDAQAPSRTTTNPH